MNKSIASYSGNWWAACQQSAAGAVLLYNGSFLNNYKTSNYAVLRAFETNCEDNYWLSLSDLYEAYLDCRKKKRSTSSCSQFEADEAQNLVRLWRDLNEHTYEIGYSNAFYVTRPKLREVFAADFRDRIVHHLVIGRLNNLFEKEFRDNTFNCRKGKGTDYGIRVTAGAMRRHPNGWVVKCDMQGFFMSIDKVILNNAVQNFIDTHYEGEDKAEIKWLANMIIMHKPECKCHKRGNISLFDYLPDNKTLFRNGDGRGLAIGNLTSQIFANYYLHPFDKWMSSIEGVEYGRYVDDFWMVSDDKDKLLSLLPEIRRRLKEELHITLHPDKVYIQPIRHGLAFTGAVIKGDRIYAGNRTLGNAINVVRNYATLSADDKKKYIKKFAQQINSYMGFMVHRNAYALRWKLWNAIDAETKRYIYCVNMAKIKAHKYVKDDYPEQEYRDILPAPQGGFLVNLRPITNEGVTICGQTLLDHEPTKAEIEELTAQWDAEENERHKANVRDEIKSLKGELDSSDYKAIKYAEGLIKEEDYAPIREARQALRDRINELEKELENILKSEVGDNR